MSANYLQDSAIDENGAHALERVMSTALELIKHSEGEYYFQVSGTSMLPLVRAGDYVRIKKISGDLRRGDIVVFQKSNGLITHRVLRISRTDDNNKTLLTKGDNSIVPDPPILSSAIIGKVIAIRRNNHEMRLDIPLWQKTNTLVGLMMAVLSKRYSVIVGPGTTKTGGELGLFNRLIRRGLITVSSLVIKLLQVIIGRWTPYNAT